MKKKILIVVSIMFVFFLIIAIVLPFFLRNKASNNQDVTQDEYDVGQVVEEIQFLTFNTYDEIEAHFEKKSIHFQVSDNKLLVIMDELYIKDTPTTIFCSLNDDKSIKRFDGKCSYTLETSSADAVWDTLSYLNYVIVKYFDVEYFEHSLYDEQGAPIDANDENSYELMLNGKGKYNLSIIDESNTYWNISAVVTDKKQIEFDFFRCFDLSTYNDNSPNIDLRVSEEIGE